MPNPEVTQLLNAIDHGDPHASEKLLPLVYNDLRRLASVKMAGEAPGQTIQATVLVHEAWLKISGNENQRWENRKHFFAAAAEAMRRILIDRARRRQRIKHGRDQKRVDMDGIEIAAPATGNDEKLLEIHEALDALAAEDPGKAEVVKLRFFVGLTAAETAEVLGVTVRTVERHWSFARIWLFQRIKEEKNSAP
jgi:RNA polymerase sigma factor (TIGR02999 family)